jgi:MoaA/NifB/PqqE/SkfB family radical SAM enzyme
MLKEAANAPIHHDPSQPTVLWDVLPPCNYRCTYCYSELLWNRAPVGRRPALPALVDAFRSWLPGWVVNFSGGEPFLWRDLPEFAGELARTHRIGIYTNLSVDAAVRRFVERVDPAQVMFVDCGFHVLERLRFDPDFSRFIKLYRWVRAAGFPIRATYIAHPDNQHRLAADVASLAAAEVRVNVRVLRGVYQGRSYPESFSPEFIELLARYECVPQRGEAVRSQMTGSGGLCRAGMVFLELAPNGDAFRCGTDRSMGRDCLGNLFAGTLRVDRAPTLCRSRVCLSCRQGMGLAIGGLRPLGARRVTIHEDAAG